MHLTKTPGMEDFGYCGYGNSVGIPTRLVWEVGTEIQSPRQPCISKELDVSETFSATLTPTLAASIQHRDQHAAPHLSANPSHCSLSFFFFRTYYVYSPYCVLLFLSISVFTFFSFSVLVCGRLS